MPHHFSNAANGHTNERSEKLFVPTAYYSSIGKVTPQYYDSYIIRTFVNDLITKVITTIRI
jgi:hypothetical protein